MELRNPAVARSVNVIRLPSEASVDHDHESQIQDIIRLPSGASVDHDHELQVHDITKLLSYKGK